jgi:hypothetical protein
MAATGAGINGRKTDKLRERQVRDGSKKYQQT